MTLWSFYYFNSLACRRTSSPATRDKRCPTTMAWHMGGHGTARGSLLGGRLTLSSRCSYCIVGSLHWRQFGFTAGRTNGRAGLHCTWQCSSSSTGRGRQGGLGWAHVKGGRVGWGLAGRARALTRTLARARPEAKQARL